MPRGQKELTPEAIFEACDDLLMKGKMPSVQKVRAVIGGGATLINDTIKLWREARGLVAANADEGPVLVSMRKAIEKQASHAFRIGRGQYADCAAKFANVSKELETAKSQVTSLEDALAEAEARSRNLEAQLRHDRDRQLDNMAGALEQVSRPAVDRPSIC